MRVLMKIELPVEQANAAMKDGSLNKKIQAILEEQKPEAAYFVEMNGRRTPILVVNFNDPAQIPAFAEPWFLAFNASVEMHPAMIASDLAKAEPDIAKAVKKFA